MQTISIATLSLFVILVMSMSVPSAFAQQDFNINFKGFSPDAPIGFHIQQFFADVTEEFTFDPIKKAELKVKHAQDIQDQIDELDRVNKVIPAEYEEKRVQKLTEVSELLTTVPTSEKSNIQIAVDKLTELTEVNKIRILWGQFPNVISSDDATKADFNKRVNELASWNNNCSGSFDVKDFRLTNESFDKLAKQCPALQDYSQNKIRMIVSGNV